MSRHINWQQRRPATLTVSFLTQEQAHKSTQTEYEIDVFVRFGRCNAHSESSTLTFSQLMWKAQATELCSGSLLCFHSEHRVVSIDLSDIDLLVMLQWRCQQGLVERVIAHDPAGIYKGSQGRQFMLDIHKYIWKNGNDKNQEIRKIKQSGCIILCTCYIESEPDCSTGLCTLSMRVNCLLNALTNSIYWVSLQKLCRKPNCSKPNYLSRAISSNNSFTTGYKEIQACL